MLVVEFSLRTPSRSVLDRLRKVKTRLMNGLGWEHNSGQPEQSDMSSLVVTSLVVAETE